ncbi:hypothetical protein BC628DRAFT_423789 [Trametes gibbosa]|nr:hypothetical protein BC628DRAFT_423789 [Trametes gibbosa]
MLLKIAPRRPASRPPVAQFDGRSRVHTARPYTKFRRDTSKRCFWPSRAISRTRTAHRTPPANVASARRAIWRTLSCDCSSSVWARRISLTAGRRRVRSSRSSTPGIVHTSLVRVHSFGAIQATLVFGHFVRFHGRRQKIAHCRPTSCPRVAHFGDRHRVAVPCSCT